MSAAPTDNAVPEIWAVVPAAGTGSRFDKQVAKQYTYVANATVLEHSVTALLKQENVQKIVVALHPDDTKARQLALLQHEKIVFVCGGQERSDSVLQALLYLGSVAKKNDWVLVHDAARPCLRADNLRVLVETLSSDPVGGILAVPATDTLKTVNAADITGTVDRSVVWQAQTPQMFRFGLLLDSLRHAKERNIAVTDEASAVEAAGHVAKVVQGSRSNIKITYPDDLALAGFYLHAAQSKQEQSP